MTLALCEIMLPSHVASVDETRNDDQEIERYTTQLHKNDVLLGRGVPVFNYSGNVRFRQIILEFKPRYAAASKHQAKNDITREIIAMIENSNGRFVREVKTSAEAASLGIPRGTKAWALVDDDAKVLKVKQALREPNLKEDHLESQPEEDQQERPLQQQQRQPEQQEIQQQREQTNQWYESRLLDSHQVMPSDQISTAIGLLDVESSSLSRAPAHINSPSASQQRLGLARTIASDMMPLVNTSHLDSITMLQLLRLREQHRQANPPQDDTSTSLLFGSSHPVFGNTIFQGNHPYIDAMLSARVDNEGYSSQYLPALTQHQNSSIAQIDEINRRRYLAETGIVETIRTPEQGFLELLSAMMQGGDHILPGLGTQGDDVSRFPGYLESRIDSRLLNLSAIVQNQNNTSAPTNLSFPHIHLIQRGRRTANRGIEDEHVPGALLSANEEQKQSSSRKRLPSNPDESPNYGDSRKKKPQK